MNVFSSVRVPKEIVSDQGANFMSKLLSDINASLHIDQIRTTPLPSTAKRSCLKSMLLKSAYKDGKDKEKLLPYLL